MKILKQQFIIAISLLFFFSCSEKKITHPAIIEMNTENHSVPTDDFINFCKNNKISLYNTFQWAKHLIIYTDSTETENLKTKLQKNFQSVKLKIYNSPFYNFNREKLTGEKAAAEWKHIIMTANLVNDTTLQNEYMEYHRTQMEKWPEISKGFIHADFQQLLVFRNGRQLMLVISIPKDKTLDELNPKTTENNPRVDEWNKIMAKYQEGIEDAPKGTTWVMFKAWR